MNELLLASLRASLLIGGLVVAAALLTWIERRLLALWQDRYGPNRVGPFGVLQVVADLIKLIGKEDVTPPFADRPVFVLAPAISLLTIMLPFAVVPMSANFQIVDMNIGLLFILAMTSVAVYGVLLGGYASNNKYALLGSLRSAAQTVSYEVFMGLSLLGVVILAGSFSLRDIVLAQQEGWFFLPQFIGMVIFFIAGVAESHRLPFDLPEAEHELTAGFHTEYSGIKFSMFFLGEYLGVILISMLMAVLFFGGWLGPLLPGWLWFLLKTSFFVVLFVLLRAAVPRPRYDQLMDFGWKLMLPLALINLCVTGLVVTALGRGG